MTKLKRNIFSMFASATLSIALSACTFLGTNQNIAVGVADAAVASVTPNGKIEQTYYLGIYDPREQLPELQFYRVKVQGQSSVLNTTKFASGWVRADLVDSLSTLAKFDPADGRVVWNGTEQSHLDKIHTGRRLILFGPEGFREAPADHRLVIVMGSSPEKFFTAIDEALGVVARATQGEATAQYDKELFETLLSVRAEKERLGSLLIDLDKHGAAK